MPLPFPVGQKANRCEPASGFCALLREGPSLWGPNLWPGLQMLKLDCRRARIREQSKVAAPESQRKTVEGAPSSPKVQRKSKGGESPFAALSWRDVSPCTSWRLAPRRMECDGPRLDERGPRGRLFAPAWAPRSDRRAGEVAPELARLLLETRARDWSLRDRGWRLRGAA